jgi:hypothetical protein
MRTLLTLPEKSICYWQCKTADCGIIFRKLMDEDLASLKDPGEKIWKQGEQELTFEII